MRSPLVLMIFQTALISSLVHCSHADRGCSGFKFDPSPYEDDSDYQDGASGSQGFDIGGFDIGGSVMNGVILCLLAHCTV